MTTIFYEKEDALYKQVIGHEKEKIASEIEKVIKVYDSGEAFFTKREYVELNVIDYLEDDMKASDETMTEPVRPTYPNWSEYDSTEEYEAACQVYEQQYEAYNELYEAYLNKKTRENLREQLKDAKKEIVKHSLYYYDGENATLVTDCMVRAAQITAAEKAPVVETQIYTQSEAAKIKMSEISYRYDIDNFIDASLFASSEHYVIVKNSLNVIMQNETNYITVNNFGNTIYFVDDCGDYYYGDLYQIKITGDKVGNPELFDTEVEGKGKFLSDSVFAYFKNTNYDSADLFIDGKEVDYDVNMEMITLDENSGVVYYYSDWNGTMGTLKTYKNGKDEKIADDVREHIVTTEGKLLYLYDYSSDYKAGTMYLYNNSKPKMIAEDVNGIIADKTEFDDSERGYNYGW